MNSPRKSIGKRSGGESTSELSIDESDEESDNSSVTDSDENIPKKKELLV